MIQFRLLKTEDDWKQWCAEHVDRCDYGEPESYPCIIGYQSVEFSAYTRRFEYTFAYGVRPLDKDCEGPWNRYTIDDTFGE